MKPGLRRAALTAHIAFSVGWLGAVVVFLVQAVLAATGRDDRLAQAVFLMMEPTAWFVLVPLSLASLVTGIVSALGTTWGLWRHYWVVLKLLLNLVATVVLLLYTRTINLTSAAARTSSGAELRALGLSPLIHAGGAFVVLLVALAIAVYKPQGRTRYGRRKLRPDHFMTVCHKVGGKPA